MRLGGYEVRFPCAKGKFTWRCIGLLPASFPLPALAKVPGRCGPWQRVWPPCHSLLCATLRQVCQWNRYCTMFEADGFILFVSESAGFKPVKIHQMSSTLFRRVYRRMILNDVCRDSTWHSESKMYRDVYVLQDVTVWLLHRWQICRLELSVHHNEPMNKRPSFEWCFQRHHLPDLQDTMGLHFASDLQKGFEWTFVAALSPHESHVQMLRRSSLY